MKIAKQCPLLIGIVAISIIITALSFAYMGTIYSGYADPVRTGKAPVLTLFFKGATDGVFPWNENQAAFQGYPVAESQETDQAVPQENPEVTADTGSSDVSEYSVPEAGITTLIDEAVSAGTEDASKTEEESAQTVEEEEDKTYEFTEVDDEYFNDALFIGDSRTVGLSEYCEALNTRATFYSKISLTIYDVLTREFIKTDKGRISIEQALTEAQYAKIYIMLGLNEIGTGNPEYFKNAYEQVINRIRELQPDAIIYIQGIMHVTADKSDNDQYFNNANINERNAALAELADQKRIFYIDMNEAVDDENGNLAKELSFDDVHLKASSYERWHDFLLHNAIVR